MSWTSTAGTDHYTLLYTVNGTATQYTYNAATNTSTAMSALSLPESKNFASFVVVAYDADNAVIKTSNTFTLIYGSFVVDGNGDTYDDTSYTAGYRSCTNTYVGKASLVNPSILGSYSSLADTYIRFNLLGDSVKYVIRITGDVYNNDGILPYTELQLTNVIANAGNQSNPQKDVYFSELTFPDYYSYCNISVISYDSNNEVIDNKTIVYGKYYTDVNKDGYEDNSVAEGYLRGSNAASTADLTDILPKILGSVSGFFVSTAGGMSVGGIREPLIKSMKPTSINKTQ